MPNACYIKVGKHKNGYIEFKKSPGSSMGMKECNEAERKNTRLKVSMIIHINNGKVN